MVLNMKDKRNGEEDGESLETIIDGNAEQKTQNSHPENRQQVSDDADPDSPHNKTQVEK